MDLINPFEEVVVFGKAYPVAWPVASATQLKALVPTGKHVGHGLRLSHTRIAGGGGKATRLERYTRGKKVSKGIAEGLQLASTTGAATAKTARSAAARPSGRIKPRPSVRNGLEMVRNMPLGAAPAGGRTGRRLT